MELPETARIEIQNHLTHALKYTDSGRRGIIKWWWKSTLADSSSPHEPIPYFVLYWSGVIFLTFILEKGNEHMKRHLPSQLY